MQESHEAVSFSCCPNAGVVWLNPFRTLAIALAPWFPFKNQTGHYFAKFACSYIIIIILRDPAGTVFCSLCTTREHLRWVRDAFWVDSYSVVIGRAGDQDRRSRVYYFSKGRRSGGSPFILLHVNSDPVQYETLNIYGKNMVGTEGADWKRHRRVANPAFNEASNAFVWIETVRVVNEWFAELDAKLDSNSSVTINAVEDLVQVTLLVVASAGFGRRASWQEDSSTKPPPGHTLAFRAAVSIALSHLFTRVLAPKWLHALSARVRLPLVGAALAETRDSFDALRAHMVDLISLSRAWVIGGKVSNMDAGLLRNLVEANMTQADDVHHKKLTDDELLSNIFTFLLAGHETSAHSLTFAIGLLALYPDVQQKIYEETLRVWPNGCPTTATPSSYKEYMPKLQYTLATFHETIRLFTPVARLGKIAHADTTLTAHRFTANATGDMHDITPFAVPVKAGSLVIIDVLALHMNPMYWGPDAAVFRPERFVDTDAYRWPRDAFFAFSGGARSCIGQRFALAESVCALASLVRRYAICVPDELRARPFEEQAARLLRWTPGVTITPTDCVVRLRRRVAVA
ncbi:cytochrome P450 [Mycena vulgaris]|nr:cytochrome P450 [Mycena vulgaris]